MVSYCPCDDDDVRSTSLVLIRDSVLEEGVQVGFGEREGGRERAEVARQDDG